MAELQVKEMVILDSTEVQEEIQVESESPPKKRRLRKKKVVALCQRLLHIIIQFSNATNFMLHRMSCCTGCHVAPDVMLEMF